MKPLTERARRDAEVIFAAMKLLESNGGEMRVADLVQTLPTIFEFTPHELEPTPTWPQRWRSVVQMMGIEIKYAGYMNISKGIWYLTEKGKDALKNGAESFWVDIRTKYRKRKKDLKETEIAAIEESNETNVNLDSIIENARDGIRKYIHAKSPYEFQFLVAALFRAMGYFTPFVAPKGKDGGVDIIAYCDPLGVKKPHIKIQVKHYPTTPISVDVLRSMIGVLAQQDEIGFIVTSGMFSSEALRESRSAHRHIRLIDMEEFIDLWIAYYGNLNEEDKSLLPITPVYYIKQP